MEARAEDRNKSNKQLHREIQEIHRSEIELLDERNFISAVLDTSSALVVVFDDQGRIVRFNRACEMATGYSFAEVKGRYLWDLLLLPDETEGVQAVFRNVVAGLFPNEYENFWVTRSGERRLISWSNTAMVDTEGSVKYVVSTGIDITERKRAEDALKASEEKYRELVENANSIILRMDTKGNVTFFNEFAQRFFGFSEEAIIGRNVVGTIVPETDSSGQDLAKRMEDISRHPELYAISENENMRRNGERVWIAWTNKAVYDGEGNVTEMLCVGNDHTVRKKAEEDLTHALDQLSILLEAARAASSSLEPREVLRLMAKSLTSAIGVRNVGIYVLDETRGQFSPVNVRTNPTGTLDPLDEAFMSRPLDPENDAFTKEVLERKEPIACFDAPTDPRTDKRIVEALGLKSLLAVPFIAKDQVLAITMVSTLDRHYTFTESQIELAKGIANAAAISIENSRLYAETRRRADEIQTLFTVQQAITSRLDSDAVLQMVADEARRLTFAEGTAVFLVEEGEIVVSVLSGEHVPGVLGYRVSTDKSLTGIAIRTGKSFLVDDVEVEQRLDAEIIRLTGLRSLVIVPLLSSARSIGAIAVASRTPNAFGQSDERVLTMLASAAVIGLENAYLYKEEQERHREAEQRRQVAESLRDILAVINSNRPLEAVLVHIVSQASRLLGADGGAIYRLNDDGETLSIQSVHGLSNSIPEGLNISLGQGWLRQGIMERKPGCISDIQAILRDESIELDPPFREYLSMIARSYSATLAVPLIVRDEIYGGILLYYRDVKECSIEDQQIAISFADQAALAIENARLRAQAEQTAVEAERSRLARDLHDAVTQTLFSASLIAEVLPRLWERNPDEGQRRLDELRQLTRGALAEMRTLLLELRPTALTEAALGDLLRQLMEAAQGRARIPVSLEVEGTYPLPPDVQITLYRIAQESLNNVCRHSGASQASMILRCSQGKVELSVIDNGQGFDPSSIPPEHLGLGIMRERAEAIGAELRLESQPRLGTQVIVTWQDIKGRDT